MLPLLLNYKQSLSNKIDYDVYICLFHYSFVIDMKGINSKEGTGQQQGEAK